MSALVYGVAVALQHHEAAGSDPNRSLRPRLLLELMARPRWLIGVAGDGGGFALQTAALAVGSLIVVQPILTLSLVVSLLLGSRLGRRALRPRDWLAVAGTLSGLAAFLAIAHPTEHSTASAGTRAWLILVAVIAVVIVLTLTVARTTDDVRRALLFAFAAACAEALMAVLAKAFGDRLRNGVWSTVASWEPYAVVVGGIITLLLVQSAYQVGRATATLPMLTVAEPIVASSIGVALFGEHVHLGGWRGPVVVVSLAVMMRSLMLIATSSVNPAMAASVGEGGLH